jgi:hypothetical protein
LVDCVGEKREIRYDPFDVSHAYVMGKSGWIEAHSTYRGELAGRSEKEIEIISQEIAAIKRRTGISEKDGARLLGDYMFSLRNQETQLALERQQARDRELRSSDQETGLLAAPADSDGDRLLPAPPAEKPVKNPAKSTFELAFESIPQ